MINRGTEVAPNFQLVGVLSSSTVPAGQTPACGKLGEFGLYVSIMNPTVRSFLDNAMNGNLNSTAIINNCVLTENCSSFPPEDTGNDAAADVLPSMALVAVLLLALVLC